MNTEYFDTDLLIIGAGSAGLWTALAYSEAMPESHIAIVDKGPAGWGGLMAMAGGDLEAVIPPDTVYEWLEDLVYYFDGLCDQTLMQKLLSDSYARFEDYERFGCEFLHKPDGALKSVPQRGLPHVKLYPARLKGRGGELMVRSLRTRLKNGNISFFGHTMLTNYLMKDGRVYGAAGFDYRNGKFVVIRAHAVVAASGMGGWKTSYGKNTPTGEGLRMAYEAGATLHDMEFVRVWNMPRLFAWEGQTHLFPLGARFVNRLGENFMSRYSPVLGPNTDPHYTTIGMALEIRAGRGPIILDVSMLKAEDMSLLKPQNGWQKINYDKLCKLGYDLFKDNTEWVPQMTVAHGGIHADADGHTGIDGLWAAGTARSLEPGVYAGGFALMTTAVTGYRAGKSVAEEMKHGGSEYVKINETEIGELKNRVFDRLGNAQNSLAPKEVLTKIQAAVFPYDVSIIKTGAALRKAATELARIREEDLPRMRAADPHYLLKLHEVMAIMFVSELYVKASDLRQETRAGHYREDYPHMDSAGPAWLFCKKAENGEADFFWKKVPLEEYPAPLTRFYQNNFNFTQ